MISSIYGYTPIDDSRPLRDGAKILYGLTDWHVSTQEGKSTIIQHGSKTASVRRFLGDLGAYFEADDEFHFPRLAVASCLAQNPEGRFVFASVRRNQPRFFKDTGRALVIEVTRKGCSPVGHFDNYDRSSVDMTLENPYDPDGKAASRRLLEDRVRSMLDPILLPSAA